MPPAIYKFSLYPFLPNNKLLIQVKAPLTNKIPPALETTSKLLLRFFDLYFLKNNNSSLGIVL